MQSRPLLRTRPPVLRRMTKIAHQLPSSPADTAHNRQNHHEIVQNCHPSTNDLQQYTEDHAKSAPGENFFGAEPLRATDHPRSSAIIDEQNRSNPNKPDQNRSPMDNFRRSRRRFHANRPIQVRPQSDTPGHARPSPDRLEHDRTPPNKADQQRTPTTSRRTRVCRGNDGVGEQLRLRDPRLNRP